MFGLCRTKSFKVRVVRDIVSIRGGSKCWFSRLRFLQIQAKGMCLISIFEQLVLWTKNLIIIVLGIHGLGDNVNYVTIHAS